MLDQAFRLEGFFRSAVFFADRAPCVHALRSFEESLLAALVGEGQEQARTDLRFAGPSSPNFAADILGAGDLEDAPPHWQEFLRGEPQGEWATYARRRLKAASEREAAPLPT